MQFQCELTRGLTLHAGNVTVACDQAEIFPAILAFLAALLVGCMFICAGVRIRVRQVRKAAQAEVPHFKKEEPISSVEIHVTA